MYSKQQITNNLFGWKRNARIWGSNYMLVLEKQKAIKRQITLLKQSPFTKNKIAKLEVEIKDCEKLLEIIRHNRATAYKMLINLVVFFDKNFESTIHEKAQILGVHHSHCERIAADHNDSDLLLMISLQGEMAYGQDWSRDYVLSKALIYVQSLMFKNDAVFRQRVTDFFQEMAVKNTGRPMKNFIQTGDGKLVVSKPKLRVVK